MKKQAKPTILILSLGGTILSTSLDPTQPFYHSPSLDINQILAQIPSLAPVANIQTETLFNIISHDMTCDMLIVLAKRVQAIIDNPDIAGIVIVQGTNALEEIAYFTHIIIKTKNQLFSPAR